jgi:hypothetical protein
MDGWLQPRGQKIAIHRLFSLTDIECDARLDWVAEGSKIKCTIGLSVSFAKALEK